MVSRYPQKSFTKFHVGTLKLSKFYTFNECKLIVLIVFFVNLMKLQCRSFSVVLQCHEGNSLSPLHKQTDS